MVDFRQRDLGIEAMESKPMKWVIKVVGREDLLLTLHESEASAVKECGILNKKFKGRFYVDVYYEDARV
jgi:hypothetical protein